MICLWPFCRRKRTEAVSLVSYGPLYDEVCLAMRAAQDYALSHGGRIELLDVTEEGDVKIRFCGACAGCPFASITLKVGIESKLREQVPGVRRIIAC